MSLQFIAIALLTLLISILLTGVFLMKDPIWFSSPRPNPQLPHADAPLLRRHVEKITQDFFPRSTFHHDQLNGVADYISQEWKKSALPVEEMSFQVAALAAKPYRNLLVKFPGSGADSTPLVIGAHYDAVESTPGADDNASGVAGLLELARLLAKKPATIPIILAAYPNEEAPNFGGQGMGSYQHALELSKANQSIRGMLSLEMLGTYLGENQSQTFPLKILSLLYPTRGNFITFASSVENYPLLHRAKKLFVKNSDFPIESFIGPKMIRGLMNSDHCSFIHFGYPAFMVTDTAYYRNARYHTPQDTADTLDYESMARVIDGLYGMLLDWR